MASPRLTSISSPSLIVLFVLVSLGAWSCGSGDNPDNNNNNNNVDYSVLSEASLVGTWKHDSFADTPDGTRTELSRNISWTFRANGDLKYKQGQSTNDFNWSLDGQNIMFGTTNKYTVVEYSKNEMTWRNNQGPNQSYYFVSRQ